LIMEVMNCQNSYISLLLRLNRRNVHRTSYEVSFYTTKLHNLQTDLFHKSFSVLGRVRVCWYVEYFKLKHSHQSAPLPVINSVSDYAILSLRKHAFVAYAPYFCLSAIEITVYGH